MAAVKEAIVIVVGQIALLVALVGSGYASVACLLGWWSGHRGVSRSGQYSAVASVVALTATAIVLTWALLARDYRLAYVARYSSADLPRHYAFAAFWVGQAGSLLLWAWLVGVLMLIQRFGPRRRPDPLSELTLGVLATHLCFLVVLMVFSADPMKLATSIPAAGAGLVPELRHPAMLLHPPVVFLGYAGWAVPFALAVAALVSGRLDRQWIRLARPWILFSWTTLGVGILLGAEWAYEELGWGGYWNWDPVENGSLLPWLMGTALVHTTMAWQHRGCLKKTTLALAMGTFALCIFATFLTRSAIFGGLHTFNQSPIGWMFLWMLAALLVGAAILVGWRRNSLASENRMAGIFSREALIAVTAIAILFLATAVLAGTVCGSLAEAVLGRSIVVDRSFYDSVATTVGIVVLAVTALAPVTGWGRRPGVAQRWVLVVSSGIALAVALSFLGLGMRHPIALVVAFLATLLVAVFVVTLMVDAGSRSDSPKITWWAILQNIRRRRRQYGGFLIHAAYACLVVGITGSSLGARHTELDLALGETAAWAGGSVRFVSLKKSEQSGTVVVQARIEVARPGGPPVSLKPAQQLHRGTDRWRGKVAICSTWQDDLYVVLHGGEGDDTIQLTLKENPLVRWIWLSGWLAAAGTVIAIMPNARPGAPDPDAL